MKTETLVNVSVTRRFSAAPERVFDAWLDAKEAGRWLFATDSGEMVRVEIDAKVGGSFTFVDLRDGEEVEHTGRYLEIDRPQLLVFTFSVGKYFPNGSRVIIEIEPKGKGCELTLTQVGVQPEYASRTEEGWRGLLEALAATLGEGAGKETLAAAQGEETYR